MRTGWGIIHNCVAHPLLVVADAVDMALPAVASLLDKFHDWTAKKAYSRGRRWLTRASKP